MKKLHILVIVAIAVCVLTSGIVFADEKPVSGKAGENATWSYDEATATLTFSGTGALNPYDSSTYQDWGVWEDEAKYVVIEEGIDNLDGHVLFGLNKVEQVALPSTLKIIGSGAFQGCSSLKNIVVPEGVTDIGINAFRFCESLQSVSLPDSLETIGNRAFEGCKTLRSIVIPDKVKMVNMSSFQDCHELGCITFGRGVQYLGVMAQTSTPRIRTLIFTGSAPEAEYGCFYNLTATIYYPDADASWNNWFRLDPFSNTIRMVAVEDPASIVPNLELNIYEGFCGPDSYWNLKEGVLRITGQGSVTSSPWHHVGTEVKKIIIEDGITSLEVPYAFVKCTTTDEVHLSKNLKEIEWCAFAGCGMKNLTIPGSLENISQEAFSHCPRLEKVVISEGVVTIGSHAFSYCEKLVDIEMPKSLERIEGGAFAGCITMTTLVIPSNVKYVGKGIISGMKNLEHIYFTGEEPEFGYVSTYGYTGFTVHIPNYLDSWKFCREGEHWSKEYMIYVEKYDCNHTYDKWSNLDSSKHTKKCSNCGQSVSADHSWTEKSIDSTPTCIDLGTKTMQCITCGATKVEYIEATGHAVDRSMIYQMNDTHHWKDCLICGEEVDKQEHQGDEICEVCRYEPKPTATPTPELTTAPEPDATPTAEPTPEVTATPKPSGEDVIPTTEPSQDVEKPMPTENSKVWILVIIGVIIAGAAVAVPIVLRKK